MSDLDSLEVRYYTVNHIPNDYPEGDLPWQVYHTVRNALVRACRRHGPTGPLGEVKIVEGVADPYKQLAADPGFWEPGDPNPTYHIIPDQYNNERYCYAELHGDNPFNADWLLSVTATLREYEEWGLGVNHIPNNYVLIFGDRLLVTGEDLSRCNTAAEVVEAVRRLLRSKR